MGGRRGRLGMAFKSLLLARRARISISAMKFSGKRFPSAIEKSKAGRQSLSRTPTRWTFFQFCYILIAGSPLGCAPPTPSRRPAIHAPSHPRRCDLRAVQESLASSTLDPAPRVLNSSTVYTGGPLGVLLFWLARRLPLLLRSSLIFFLLDNSLHPSAWPRSSERTKFISTRIKLPEQSHSDKKNGKYFRLSRRETLLRRPRLFHFALATSIKTFSRIYKESTPSLKTTRRESRVETQERASPLSESLPIRSRTTNKTRHTTLVPARTPRHLLIARRTRLFHARAPTN